jgi:NAD(P)-dependent dehydrogenase (short-subunit alcohol dehydrogenase family)
LADVAKAVPLKRGGTGFASLQGFGDRQMDRMLFRLAAAGAMGLGGTILAKGLIRRARWFDYRAKTAIITGGSRGLGLVLARQLVEQGAQIAICARTPEDLDLAATDLRQRGGNVLAIRCDVRSQPEVEMLVRRTVETFGNVDLLFNVAGIIEAGPLETMTVEDFRRSMETHCWGPLHTTLAVLPHMRSRGWGRIVNVSSIGGKQAVPHLAPYCTSKFALVGLSNALRTELAKDNILVTTVCPGLMRTGSPRNARFKGRHRAEYAWFCIGDSLPVVSMDARRAAAQILRACQFGEPEVVVANYSNLAMYLPQYLPRMTTEVLSLVNSILPKPGGIGRRAARGYESESAWAPSILTTLTEQAAEQNNEMRLRNRKQA